MQISVLTFEVKTIKLEEVQSNDTIQNIKKKIQSQEGIRTDLQRLVFSDKSLENTRTLSYYGIVDESILYLVMRKYSRNITFIRIMLRNWFHLKLTSGA
jgi:transposase-like protein